VRASRGTGAHHPKGRARFRARTTAARVRTPLPPDPSRSILGAMSSKTAVSCLLAVLLVPAGLLAGCGQSAADKAKTKVCDARDDIGKQVKSLQGLTLSTASASQLTNSVTAIKNDLSTIADNRGDLSDQLKNDVQAANDQFAAAVKQVGGSIKTASLATAKTQITQALQQLATSYENSFAKLRCS
jgi:ABC-type transporter Mla subunit MlaD